MDSLQKNSNNKRGRHEEVPIESISDEEALSSEESEREDDTFEQELKEAILREAEREIPDFEDDEKVFKGVMAKVLAKLTLEEPFYEELPTEQIDVKIEEKLDEDIENCKLIIDRLSVHIEKQMDFKNEVDERRKILSIISKNMENHKVENPENVRNIPGKVNVMFNLFRRTLRDLIDDWSGDDSSDISDILSAVARARLENTGPDGEAGYVEIGNFRRDLIQMLVSNRIITVDATQELMKYAL